MKNSSHILIFLVAVIAATAFSPALADRYRRNKSDNPFRLISYVVHPVGILLEYSVMRPIHWVVSQPHLDIIFGHQPSLNDEGTYFEWVHGDFSPSIAEEIRMREEREATRASEPSID
ncbi:MAG: hypothetical protein JJU11_10090 [Candidatus Sumerlaeia bacterium]|nr:hypothetical protein [Candidatus Sumerlaeia bacterium]